MKRPVRKYTKGDEGYKHSADHFWDILEEQNRRCDLTGRLLNQINLEIELKEPFKAQDRDALENHYAVEKSLSYLTRHLSKRDVIKLAVEILKYSGEKYGYEVIKKGKSK